jgi:dTDP-4-dehydrorhamnose 3,5-epimerase
MAADWYVPIMVAIIWETFTMGLSGKRDPQTVTPEGKSLKRLIDGVKLRPAITHPDDRGSLCEIFSSQWAIDDGPVCYVYMAMLRPHKIKGWVVHREQDDRLFVTHGTVRFVLYDDRPESPTHKMISELFIGEQNRTLVCVPKGVYHALQNVGDTDATFINVPTKPYNHANPDKFRLPLVNDLIPYRFDDRQGG